MRVLWLQKFDFSGNVETVMAWASGVKQKGIELDLVINGIPEPLKASYNYHLKKSQVNYFINITTQQINNLFFYKKHTLLHSFHPSFFNLSTILGDALKIPWFVTLFSLNDLNFGLDILKKAAHISCSNPQIYEKLKKIHFSHDNISVIHPGLFIKHFEPEPLPARESKKLNILFIGSRVSPCIKALQHAARNLKDCHVTYIYYEKPPEIKGVQYSWPPVDSNLFNNYNAVAGYGFYLLSAQSLGRIGLILDNSYGGLVQSSHKQPVTDLRGLEYDDEDKIRKALLYNLRELLEDPAKRKELQKRQWSYLKDNHDLYIVSEHLARLYRQYIP